MAVATLHALALLLYTGAAAGLGVSLASGRPGARTAATVAGAAGLGTHAAALIAYAAAHGEPPLVGLAPSLSTLAFLIALLHAAAAAVRGEASSLGLVLAPLVALLVGAALLLGIRPAGEALAFRGVWFSLHVVLAFIGYAGLAVAFAAGLMYLLQLRTLEDKRFGRMFRFFPSLETADRLGGRALGVGFPALSGGIVIGFAWLARFGGAAGAREAEIIWGVLTWFVFVAAFAARSRGITGGRRGALASVLGFVVVVLAFVVLRLSMAPGRWFL